ncbi:hypothetical protein K488DRAFT_29744, partial [Vararia minispora EC-137]
TAASSPQTTEFVDPVNKFWNSYLRNAEEEDKVNIENWKGDTDGILIFMGLFAATVSAFIIESYKQLSPDSGDETVVLLGQIAAALNGMPIRTSDPPPDSFRPQATAVVVNVLWFLSLILSLICALGATLIQQWARNYQRKTQHHYEAPKRGIHHIFLSKGVRRFGLGRASSWIITFLHVAVTLFMIGLVVFLFPVNSIVAGTSLSIVGMAACVYVVLSVLPGFSLDCPFNTPFTPALV